MNPRHRHASHADILAFFALEEDQRLGAGGEASVYALDDQRIVRIPHDFATATGAASHQARVKLLGSLVRDGLGYRVPEIVDIVQIGASTVTVEARIPGDTLASVLAKQDLKRSPAQQHTRPLDRAAIIRDYLECTARLSAVIPTGDWYGDIGHRQPIRTATWHEYLQRRAAANLADADADLQGLEVPDLTGISAPARPRFVHLDVFPGNVMIDDNRVSGIIDFGVLPIMGDPRLDVVAAVAYLHPNISPGATNADRAIAATWLAEANLTPLYTPYRQWLAAFWSHARNDAPLNAWCHEVLLSVGQRR